MNIRPMVAKFLHAEGHTDRYDKPNRRFLQFCRPA